MASSVNEVSNSSDEVDSSSKTARGDLTKSPRVDLDVIVAELGQLGWFQLRLMGLCAVVAIFAAWAASEYLFTTARISTR